MNPIDTDEVKDAFKFVTITVSKEHGKWKTTIADVDHLELGYAKWSDLLTVLKKDICRSGGSYTTSTQEIDECVYILQGEHRKAISTFLRSKGITRIKEIGFK